MTTPRRAIVSPHGSPGYAGGVDLADCVLVAFGVVLAAGCVLWVGASLAALVTGRGMPRGGLQPALTAAGQWREPAQAWPHPEQLPGWIPYWSCTLLVVSVVVGGMAVLALHLWRRTIG